MTKKDINLILKTNGVNLKCISFEKREQSNQTTIVFISDADTCIAKAFKLTTSDDEIFNIEGEVSILDLYYITKYLNLKLRYFDLQK